MRKDILDKVLKNLNINIENTELTPEQVEEDLSTISMASITLIRVTIALKEAFYIEISDEYQLQTEMNTLSKMIDAIATVFDNQNNKNGE